MSPRGLSEIDLVVASFFSSSKHPLQIMKQWKSNPQNLLFVVPVEMDRTKTGTRRLYYVSNRPYFIDPVNFSWAGFLASFHLDSFPLSVSLVPTSHHGCSQWVWTVAACFFSLGSDTNQETLICGAHCSEDQILWLRWSGKCIPALAPRLDESRLCGKKAVRSS